MAGELVEYRPSSLRLKALREPGNYEDGGGLRVVVEPSGTKRWVVRVTVSGQCIERGLGAFLLISLESARAKAGEIRRAAEEGVDLRVEQRARELGVTTFRQMFDISFAQRQKQLSNAKHLKQWSSTMEAYVLPRNVACQSPM